MDASEWLFREDMRRYLANPHRSSRAQGSAVCDAHSHAG
jgi:hypothetical protein